MIKAPIVLALGSILLGALLAQQPALAVEPERAEAASEPSPSASPPTSAQARAEARDAAERVKELLEKHRRYEAGIAEATGQLVEAFHAGAAAERDRDAAVAELHSSRREQSARLRALYLNGGLGFSLSLLSAETPQDALWGASVAPRVGARVIADAATEQQLSRRRAVVASQRVAQAATAADEVGAALVRLHDQQDAATTSLAQARKELADLDAAAQRLAAAEAAAAAIRRAEAEAEAQRVSLPSESTAALGIPSSYLQSYRAAATTCSGLRWTLLAAVGQVESGHGRNNGPSSAGAIGPMQFMPATFAEFGVDADANGEADPWNAQDAIATAARYLCARGIDGTPAGDQKALFAYNRAQWYVDLVLSAETGIAARFSKSVN